jgi:hypothetical protein
MRQSARSRFVRCGLSVIATVIVAGCGGAGVVASVAAGGNSPAVTAGVTSISAHAEVTDADTPPLEVTLSVSDPPSSGVYLAASGTFNGVNSLAPGTETGNRVSLYVVLKPPHTLAPATYTDTILVKVCSDPACQRQIRGSPVSISVQYVVMAVNGAEAPTLLVPTTSLFAQALPSDPYAPSDANPTVTIRNVPSFRIHVTVAATTNGLESATFPGEFVPGDPGSGNGAQLAVRYRAPSGLPPGLYQDTITITACLDDACVNPLAGSPTTIQSTYQIGNDLPGLDGYTVTAVPLQANDIIWDASHSVIYAAVAASSPNHASSIAIVDPLSGTINAVFPLGAEPSLLAISADGQYLYAALKGAPSVARFALPAMAREATIDIGADPQGFPLTTWDLQVAPGNSRTIAVARSIAANAPQSRGVVIIDDQTPRSLIGGMEGQNRTSEIDVIQWGASANVLYGADVHTSGEQLVTMSVDASGATVVAGATQHVAGQMHFLDDLLYLDTGTVFDPRLGKQVGALTGSPTIGAIPVRGVLVPDRANSRIFRLTDNMGGSYNYIGIYDLATYQIRKSFTIIGVTHAWPRLIRWGPDGLAYASTDGRIVIIQGAYITS